MPLIKNSLNELDTLLTHLEEEEFIRNLIKNPRNIIGKDGSSLIDVAARQGNHQALLWLIALDLTDSKQDPLYLSISNEHLLCSNILIACGANIESAKEIATKNNDEKSLIVLNNLSISADLILSLLIWGIKNNKNVNSKLVGLNLTKKVFANGFEKAGINTHLRAENFLDDFFGLAELAALQKQEELIAFYYDKCNKKFRTHNDFATVGYYSYVNNLNLIKPLINEDTNHIVLTAQQLLENKYEELFLQCHSQMNEDQKNEFTRASNTNEEEKSNFHNKNLYHIGKYNFEKSMAIYTSASEIFAMATYAFQRKNYVAFNTFTNQFLKLRKTLLDKVALNSLNRTILLPILICQTANLINFMDLFVHQLQEGLELNFSQSLTNSALYQLLNQQICMRVYADNEESKTLLQKLLLDFQISQEKFQEVYCKIQFRTNKQIKQLSDTYKEELKSLLLQYGYKNLTDMTNRDNLSYFDRLPHDIVEYMFNFLNNNEKIKLSTTSLKLHKNKINHTSFLILQFRKQMSIEMAEKHFYEHLDYIFTKNNLWSYLGAPSLATGAAALLGVIHYAWYKVISALIEGNQDWAPYVLAPLAIGTVMYALPLDAIILFKFYSIIRNFSEFTTATKEQLDSFINRLEEFFQAPIMKKRFLKIPLSEYSEELQLKARGLLSCLREYMTPDMTLKTMENKIEQIEEQMKRQQLNLRFFTSTYKQGYPQQIEIKVEEINDEAKAAVSSLTQLRHGTISP